MTIPSLATRAAARIAAATLLSAAACGGPTAPAGTGFPEFTDPRPVAIVGYDGEAMEPFLSRDGAWLFFNNRNDPAETTDLHLARRISADTFQYVSPLAGANVAGALDAVASMDGAGRFYWVSTRSYFQTLASLYQGRFAAGAVTGASLVAGSLVRGVPGWLTMDAEISADGRLLYYADARFDGGTIPVESKLRIAAPNGARFDLDPRSDEILRAVNATATLVYAPATSADGLELFYTAWTSGLSEIFRATRRATSEPFSAPSRIAAATGLVEAPTISPDGKSLYYHRLDGTGYRIYRLRR